MREPKTARGQPPALLTFDQCIDKYRGCVEGLLPQERIARSIELLRDFRRAPDVGEIVRAVRCLTRGPIP